MNREFHLQIDSGGRMVIPRLIRKELNIQSGTRLVAKLQDGEIHLTPMKKVIQNAQALVAQYCNGKDLVQELFEMRRDEVKKERTESL